MSTPNIKLTTEFREADRVPLVAMLRAYERGLGVSLCFQNFADELTDLPGEYAAPDGALILARGAGDGLVGVVALRALDRRNGLCEMKRLYVSPEGRGQGLGRRLALAVIAEARRLGYHAMRLDTLPGMREAQSLYAQLGFRDVGNYNGNPMPGTRFLEKDLEAVP